MGCHFCILYYDFSSISFPFLLLGRLYSLLIVLKSLLLSFEFLVQFFFSTLVVLVSYVSLFLTVDLKLQQPLTLWHKTAHSLPSMIAAVQNFCLYFVEHCLLFLKQISPFCCLILGNGGLLSMSVSFTISRSLKILSSIATILSLPSWSEACLVSFFCSSFSVYSHVVTFFIIEFSWWFCSTVPISSETLFLIICISVSVNLFLLVISLLVFANLFASMLSLSVGCFSRHISYVSMVADILGFKCALWYASITPLYSSFDHFIRVAFWLISDIAT